MMTPERWSLIQEKLEVAVALDPGQRASFLEELGTADPNLREELESLLAQDSSSRNLFKTSAMFPLAPASPERDPMIGRRLGPYQVVDLLGVGGMGEVYRAFRADDVYKQQVAIKLVRAGRDSFQVFGRFKTERQILATLDHPNIARLLDGGATQEGVPYLVMELIEGQPIDEYCDRNKLNVSERLNLFAKVCGAVQYAHSRLIVHRDLKPGNILVTAQGQPKLLDFGIAKILDPGVLGEAPAATLTMVRVLTPAYASPEQVKGETITTASDVYSLGVILYELLTGHCPYRLGRRDVDAISRAVVEFEPEKPSSVIRRVEAVIPNQPEITPAIVSATREVTPEKLRRRLRGDLDTIALMALRKEPARRYASAEQFGEDIRRHMESLPVVARNDTAGYRISKFVARHKLGVASTALAMSALIVALLFAVHEGRIAQRRFDDVRSLANSLIFDVHDAIQDLPGSTPARKLIVAKAVQYLDGLAPDSQRDPALQREIAAGYRRIGEVDASNLGDPAGALVSFKKALAIRKALVASRDGDLDDLVEFALLTRQVGGKTSMLGDIQDSSALDTYRQAAQMLETALAQHPDHVGIMRELMLNYSAQAEILAGGFALLHLGDTSAAIQPSRRRLELAQRLCDLQPANQEFRRDLANSLGTLGDELYATGQDREAFEDYGKAQKILGDLITQWPTPKARLSLYDSYYRMVPIKIVQGDLGGATSDARHLVEISAKLSQDDPQNRVPRLLLAAGYAELADTLSRSVSRNDHTEARSAMARALSIDEELVRAHPKSPEFPDMQAQRFREAGHVLQEIGDHERALSYYRQAIAHFSAKAQKDSIDAGQRHMLAGSYNGMGSALVALHRLKEAESSFRKVLELNSSGTDSDRKDKDEEALYQIADAYSGLAADEAILGSDASLNRAQRIEHWQSARADYDLSLQVWSRVPRPRLLSPEGNDCTTPVVVRQRLAKVNSTLQGLRAGDHGAFVSATIPHDK